MLYTQEEYTERLIPFFRSEILKKYGNTISEEQVTNLVKKELAYLETNGPIAIEDFDFSLLHKIPIIAGDDVAMYVESLPKGTDMSDVVSSMAPPFQRFFIEFQGVPNHEQFNAWGVLVIDEENPDSIKKWEGADVKPRWLLKLITFAEREKGKPFGPITRHYAGLAEDGTWLREEDGGVFWCGGPVKFKPEPPEEVIQSLGDIYAQLLFPALLTISFMHCKNIELKPVVPPQKLSLRHRKEKGRELVRYHVLEIAPIRRLLDKYRRGEKSDLRNALHICRGHFKTFTADAPLLGRSIGTYWWAPQVRGAKDAGIVLKDYRVTTRQGVGTNYRSADENPRIIEQEIVHIKDPDRIGRGLVAHNITQNKIAGIIRILGYQPRSHVGGEPEFDIAWKVEENTYVCEVKSLTVENEERQLRLAIGQVIRYRQKMNAM
jgi:hypothetical protein